MECFYITGQSDRPAERTVLIEEAHFNHPEIKEITEQAFSSEMRSESVTNEIKRLDKKVLPALTQESVDVTPRLPGAVSKTQLTLPTNREV